MNKDNNNPVSAISHHGQQRANIPTTELAGEEMGKVMEQEKEYGGKAEYCNTVISRGQDPELFWLQKYRNDDEETQASFLKVDTRSLYVHEVIQPEALIRRLYKIRREKSAQLEIFADAYAFDPEQDELERLADYYKYGSEWKNRLIQGDSLLVMNSLLQREQMAGKVQMIYIDPPYGIKFGSNWQMKMNSRDVKDNDQSLSGEPEMIKAFRDTWELAIHSYLSYLRDRLVLAKQLLTESGSCFVQISDENVHLVRNILDEVFGSENCVSQIIFQKTANSSTTGLGTGLGSVADYILWYAKDKTNVKYRQLYFDKSYIGDSKYINVELEDGSRRTMTPEEKKGVVPLPKNSKVFRYSATTSQSGEESSRYEVLFQGKTYRISKGSWKTSPEGMKKLIQKNRISAASNSLDYVRYFDDFPYIGITNLWTDVLGIQSRKDPKVYVVQTSTKAVQRCLLMTTDPGDLVLDPTCGSGTTAYVSEQWGRRWITIDTSRIALNIAKKRLMTATFPYYELFDKTGGDIRQGFIYKHVPHITLKSLANDEPPQEETLYDQPKENKKKIRVSGPFTIDTLQNYNAQSPESLDDHSDDSDENRIFQERIFAHLQTSGVRNGYKNQQAKFHQMESYSSPFLHARGYYTDDNGEERLAYFHIGPKFGTVSKMAVNEAIREFRGKYNTEQASWLIILGFSFEDTIDTKDYNFGNFQVSKVRMNDDLMQDGLLKKDKGAASFVIIGEPDIVLNRLDDGRLQVEVRGLDIYDPIKSEVKARNLADIAYWEIDDDYDGKQFIVRGVYFCGGDKKEFAAWKKGLNTIASQKTKKNAQDTLRLEFNDELWDAIYTYRSAPIDYHPGRKIAVRVVSQYGEESSKILTIE